MSRVGIIGATGAVGQELLYLLKKQQFPLSELRLYASERSAGNLLCFGDDKLTVQPLTPYVFRALDIAFFCAGRSVSRRWAKYAANQGCLVIDNSAEFRMDPSVPLVVPEINPEALRAHSGIVANPNCMTAIALMGLYPLHQAFGLKRFWASTYQAVSGAGLEGVQALKSEIHTESTQEANSPFPHAIAQNIIPKIGASEIGGYTEEEKKLYSESQKILGLEGLRVSATCVRVPVMRSHCASIQAEFSQPLTLAGAREVIENVQGVDLLDIPGKEVYPMPINADHQVRCKLGRLRVDTALDNGLSFWIAGDQLWKGAALNALQIAEMCLEGALAAL